MSNILILDDNLELLDTLQLCFKETGYTVKTTSCKHDFYEQLDAFQPDILLLDVRLGSEDGRVICRMVRDDKRYSELPIILFSSSPHKLEDYKTYGADGALEKPFEIKDISTIIDAAKEHRKIALEKRS
jgi:DNA-binding response OmpR family regulator